MTTDIPKKETCPSSKLAWKFSLVAFLAACIYVPAWHAYYASLKTNLILPLIIPFCVVIAILSSIIGFILGFTAIFQIFLKKSKQKGIGRAMLGIALPFLTAGFISPTMGIIDQFIYLNMVSTKIVQFLNTNNTNTDIEIERKVLFHDYDCKMEEHTDAEIPYVKLCFQLYPPDNSNLPEHFEAIIYKGMDRVECKVVDSLGQ